jgi:hypothetical protein
MCLSPSIDMLACWACWLSTQPRFCAPPALFLCLWLNHSKLHRWQVPFPSLFVSLPVRVRVSAPPISSRRTRAGLWTEPNHVPNPVSWDLGDPIKPMAPLWIPFPSTSHHRPSRARAALTTQSPSSPSPASPCCSTILLPPATCCRGPQRGDDTVHAFSFRFLSLSVTHALMPNPCRNSSSACRTASHLRFISVFIFRLRWEPMFLSSFLYKSWVDSWPLGLSSRALPCCLVASHVCHRASLRHSPWEHLRWECCCCSCFQCLRFTLQWAVGPSLHTSASSMSSSMELHVGLPV